VEQTLEAVHSKRLAALEADQFEAKRLFDAHDAAYQTHLIETEAHHKNFVTEAKFAVFAAHARPSTLSSHK
jgi:hypothetical protein